MPYTDYGYLDPVHVVWRAGTESDPYIDKIEYLKVVNQKVVLSEIPDKFSRVRVSGMFEINYDGTPKKTINPNEFSVNYSTGVIQFSPIMESSSLTFMYKGKGYILIPTSRIYHHDIENDLIKTLDVLVREANEAVNDAKIKTSDYVAMRDVINDRITNVNKVISESIYATESTLIAIDKAYEARDQAYDARDQAIFAYESTVTVHYSPVQYFDDIELTYPEPENGARVMVTHTGDIYRYDGIDSMSWELVENWTGGSIPFASEFVDGLMRKEDYDINHSKSVYFILPTLIEDIQKPVIKFPYNGEILNITAYCSFIGMSIDTEMYIQSISEEEFKLNGIWEDVAKITIESGSPVNAIESIDEEENEILLTEVYDQNISRNSLFRVRVPTFDNVIGGVTIQIDIKI